MEWKIIHIDETDSTNQWLRNSFCSGLNGQTRTAAVHNSPCQSDADIIRNAAVRNSPCQSDANIAVVAEFQTAGRGCGTNRWESERGKNLLFSMLIHPNDIAASRQFHISMAVSLAICEALGQYIGDLSIKWPNDIYWRNGKIGGILIENTLQGTVIKDSIIGVGLNVNQRMFHSDAPNPVSVWQICERDTDREQLLRDILAAFDRLLGQDLRQQYLSQLYRRHGFHPYTDNNGAFMAELVDVEDSGYLVLRDDNGQKRRYAFKEVAFVI